MKVKAVELKVGDKVSIPSIIEALENKYPEDYKRESQKPTSFDDMDFRDYYQHERNVDNEVVLGVQVDNTIAKDENDLDNVIVSLVFEDYYEETVIGDYGKMTTYEYWNPIWAINGNLEVEVIERGLEAKPTLSTEQMLKQNNGHSVRRFEVL